MTQRRLNKDSNKLTEMSITSRLLQWYDVQGRKDLPWQKSITPYRVWISEIMLQQTQVATVIPYYQKFMHYFPTLKDLALANLDEVLHLWTGLGYYARARNIYKTAQILIQNKTHELPNNFDELIKLPGIGRSTAGAILSIAYNIATPILDGNVKRVLCRYHAIEGYPGDKSISDQLWLLASQHTSHNRCADYTQAIMDLGATVCIRKRPLCERCPIKSNCKALLKDAIEDYPYVKVKKVLPTKQVYFLIFKDEQDRIYLEKRPIIGIWGGLWSFPEYQGDDQGLISYCKAHYQLKILNQTSGQPFRHTFSHFHLQVTPLYLNVKTGMQVSDSEQARWSPPSALPQIGLSTPVKRLLEELASLA